MRKNKIKKFLIILISILSFLYALFLLWLIPTLFFNYSGNWMKKISEKLAIKEIDTKKQNLILNKLNRKGGQNEKSY